MSNSGIFSRLTSVNKQPEAEKAAEVEAKTDAATSAVNWWPDDFQINFIPPPPRPPFLEELVTDGLTTCDLCAWAWNEKSSHPLEGGNHETEAPHNILWVLLLIVVSFCSAILGAFCMITALKYRRSNAVRAYATRSVSIKNSEMSPERQDQKQRQQEMQNSSNIDLKFFMEENNEEAFYATLDDQDSINSENLTNFQKPPSKNDENELPVFSSAPSSAYYSDMSNPEKQYESIENFGTMHERSEFSRGGGAGTSFITLNNSNVITNRLSAISENNFSSQSRDVNTEYV